MKLTPLLLTLSLLSPIFSVHADSNSFDKSFFSIESSQSEDARLLKKFNKLNKSKQQLLIATLIKRNQTDIIKLLAKTNFDFNYPIKGSSPLHGAVILENLDIIKILLNNNTDIEFKDKDKETALKSAVRTENLDIIKYLISQGADVNASGKNDSAPITTAAYKGNKRIIELLVKNGADIHHKQESNGWTLLHYAAKYNHSDLVDYLIKNKLKIDGRSERGFSPLAIASGEGHLNVVEALLKYSPDIELPTVKQKNTPLQLASAYGHTDVVRRLLKAGANLDYTNKNKRDALWFAAKDSHSETAEVLLKKIDDKNKVLFKAIQDGDFEIVRTLLKAGVDINARNDKDATTLDVAARYGHLNIVKLLQKNGADIHQLSTKKQVTPLMRAAGWGKKDVVKYLLTQGADVNIKSTTGWTAALSTARHHSLKTLKLLVEHGARLDESTNSGWTLLMVAVKGKKTKTIEYLIKQGLDTNIKNNKGDTALDLAIKYKHKKIIEILKKAKTNQKLISKA